MKIISIVLVSYNSGDYIESCLNSIFAQGYKDCEIIIIDNASKDRTKSIIKTKYPGIILIENSENFGPSGARNQGIAKASGKFILCLDHDTKLRGNFLENIYQTIESDARIGAVQPRVLGVDGKTIYSTGIYPSFFRRFYDIGSGSQDTSRFNQKKQVFGVSAACAMYRREALETIRQGEEYFDEDLSHK